MPNQETKVCQNCKKHFEIEGDDFEFYKMMNVPVPTWCVDCRLQRRLAFRNERSLYKRKCDVPGHSEELISMYSADKKSTVFDHKFWWSDGWDALDYGRDYDFNRPFFDQFQDLLTVVPVPSLYIVNAVNSDYGNYNTDNKNCYLVFGGDFNEDCAYSTFNFHSKDSLDLYFSDHCELCYECVDTNNSYRVLFSRYANDCNNSAFLFNCIGLSNCVGCVNLRKKSYCIFNVPYSKEEYEKRVAELKLNTYEGIRSFRRKFEDFRLKFPYKYAQIIKSVNSTGDSLTSVKNAINCFDVTGPAENLKDVFLAGWGLKDARGCNHIGHQSELVHDAWGIFANSSKAIFSLFIASSHDIQYTYSSRSSNNLFGCASLRNKSYCILNKQYSKEEYERLVPKIIEHMQSTGEWGQFFPATLSPFAYNETIAQEYFPLSRQEAAAKGFQWKDSENRENKHTIESNALPENIAEVKDDILKELIHCEHAGNCQESCTKAFRLIPSELQFYRRLNLPIPRLCPSCRHYQRFRSRNPIKLWSRECQCAGERSLNNLYINTGKHHHGTVQCNNEFQTTYAPERPEIIYCEQCYQNEIV